MAEPQVAILQLFLSYFPPHVLKDIFLAVVKTYPQTVDQLKLLWPGDEGIEVRPHIQRANVIQSLRAVGQKYRAAGIEATDLPNVTRTSRNLLLKGGAGSLTPHYIPEKASAVRTAAYRRILCSPNILDLFTLETLAVNTPLHAYLVHGCDGLKAYQRVDKTVPDFVYVRFPIVGEGVYAAQSLDLMEMFPEVLGAGRSSAVDHEIEDMAMPEFLDDTQTGNAG